MESPANTEPALFKNVPPMYFNLTATYRTDSDIRMFYGAFRERSQKVNISEKVASIIKKKKNLALQLVSNCHTQSNRETLAKELGKFMNITSYGSCFGRTCDEKCEEDAVESHFFYLAFENSVCPDYVSEKFFRLSRGIVPVVLSRKIAQNVAPSESFIAVDDFPTPKDLAEYLIHVAAHKQLYALYLRWMESYEVEKSNWGACDLCKAAHEKPKSVKHAENWWNSEKCWVNYAALNLKSDANWSSFASDCGFLVLLLMIFVVLFAQNGDLMTSV
ncbi:hypothetical protein L596_030001 [Steinernema carpocapsae]|uniref:Fucosyltransferase n=1 Tax=Steinernema carpocapsae TaxID=34508 RepID=A0A4U5LRF9_STECR|nr:hypothetical protein L596_030001 [Steinernema carpocapsae]